MSEPAVRRRRNEGESNGAPGRSRTCDPRFRKPVLYPAELRAREAELNSNAGRTRSGTSWVSHQTLLFPPEPFFVASRQTTNPTHIGYALGNAAPDCRTMSLRPTRRARDGCRHVTRTDL